METGFLKQSAPAAWLTIYLIILVYSFNHLHSEDLWVLLGISMFVFYSTSNVTHFFTQSHYLLNKAYRIIYITKNKCSHDLKTDKFLVLFQFWIFV